MLEGSTMEMGKMYIFLFMIFSFFALAGFFTSINHANEFKTYINYQIESNGGLTSKALDNIEKYNDEHYDGKFTITSPVENEKFPYGKQVDYSLKTTYKFFFIPLGDQAISVKGSALSLVR